MFPTGGRKDTLATVVVSAPKNSLNVLLQHNSPIFRLSSAGSSIQKLTFRFLRRHQMMRSCMSASALTEFTSRRVHACQICLIGFTR